MKPSWILAHLPTDLNGHILSSVGTPGGGRGGEESVLLCLFNVQREHRAATYAPDITFSRVCTDVSLSLVLTAEMGASRGQLREGTVALVLHVWYKNLVYVLSWSQTWCCSVFWTCLIQILDAFTMLCGNLGHILPLVIVYSNLGTFILFSSDTWEQFSSQLFLCK